MPYFCNSIYISNHPHSDWSQRRTACRVNILPLKGRLLAALKELSRASSEQCEILQSPSKGSEDADMQTTRSQVRLSHLLSTKSKSWQAPFPGRKPAALGIKSFTEVEHTDVVLLSSLLSPRFPPPGQAPGCAHFQINLDAGLALSLGTDIQLNPTFQNDLCMCLTASPVLQITPEIEKRSWVIFLAALIIPLYWHQLVLNWSTPSGPKSNLLFTVYLPAVYFQYLSELVEWEKAALLHF